MSVLRARADANRRTPTPERANAARTRHWPSHRRTAHAAGCATRQVMSTVGQATADHDRAHCAAQECSCRSIRFFGYSGVGQPCRHARGRTQITRSDSARAATLATGSPHLSAGRRALLLGPPATLRNDGRLHEAVLRGASRDGLDERRRARDGLQGSPCPRQMRMRGTECQIVHSAVMVRAWGSSVYRFVIRRLVRSSLLREPGRAYRVGCQA
jgi:hypothetical protein